MFSASAKEKSIQPILALLKQKGHIFTLLDYSDQFAKANNPTINCYGLRYFEGKKCIRFNYTAADGYAALDSVDIWYRPKTNPDKAVLTVGMSDEQVADAVALGLANKIEEMVEYTEKKKRAIIKAIPDVSTPAQERIEQSLNARPARNAKDIDQLFVDLHDLVVLVAKGTINSLICVGSGGAGKSFTVEEALVGELKGTGKSFLIKKGAATGKALYTILHNNRESLIVFDDCDSIFNDPNGVNVLKAALDTKKHRWVSWNAERMGDEIESDFIFEGQLIFISNLSYETIDKKTQGALMSRSAFINFNLTSDEILSRIGRILGHIRPEVDMELKQQVLERMKTIAEKTNKMITVRGVERGIAIMVDEPDKFDSLMPYNI